jgi:hypothetical protein
MPTKLKRNETMISGKTMTQLHPGINEIFVVFFLLRTKRIEYKYVVVTCTVKNEAN